MCHGNICASAPPTSFKARYIILKHYRKTEYVDLFSLCWGLTSQSTIFQSCRDGATASWVINQYFRGVKCLAQGHNMAAVGFEPPTSRSGVRHSTTEPPRFVLFVCSLLKSSYEQHYDKTNNMACMPSKDSDEPGIHPVWSESSLSAWRSIGSLTTHWEHSEDSHFSYVTSVHFTLEPVNFHISFCKYLTEYKKIIWATTRQNVSSGVSDQTRHKPACAATDAS